MLSTIVAIITVSSWGAWLAPSQTVKFPNQQVRTFYVALTYLLMASVVALFRGIGELTLSTFMLPFAGGIIWAVSCLAAFTGTDKLGMAKAFGIWAPMNIVVSIIWGMVLFGEFLRTGVINQVSAFVSVIVIIIGIFLIIFAGEDGSQQASKTKKDITIGLTGAFGAGILWGTYFIPIRISEVSMWVAAFPLAAGMFVGSIILVMISRASIVLEKPGDYARASMTGLLWGIGNYGALLTMELIGTGKGFTIASLCVVVNALIGIFWFKDPSPRSKAAVKTFIGILLATIAGIVLGNLK